MGGHGAKRSRHAVTAQPNLKALTIGRTRTDYT